MSMEPKYILVVTVVWLVVAWLIAGGFIIIPRLIFTQPITTNTTLTDVVNAIYSLKDTIYATMGVGVGILITVIGIGVGVIVAVMLALK
ncbi:hypothetical protein ES695_13485 [Candidatus Atribacteria bacterium 1244-E10-H5-B2]|nr:MAG: hypothetical protein ES695_13485 [Candidatus Atribacteria bacterium 1244-E10-H5-B2]